MQIAACSKDTTHKTFLIVKGMSKSAFQLNAVYSLQNYIDERIWRMKDRGFLPSLESAVILFLFRLPI